HPVRPVLRSALRRVAVRGRSRACHAETRDAAAYFDFQDQDAGKDFLQMEGALHVSAEPEPRASIQLHEEMEQGPARAVETYGLAFVLPGSGYVEAGRLVPASGWKHDDDRAFTRREFVFLPAFPRQSARTRAER
ncbi:hypothetical protein K8I85_13615, partial [bacterium]|nr:hypothetical protein [bacterium]